MQKFCKKCGQKLDERTGLCPNCDRNISRKEKRTAKKEHKKAIKKEKKAEKWAQLTMGQKIKTVCLKILIIVLILLLFVCGATGTLVYFDIVDIPVIAEIFDFFNIKSSEKDAQIPSETEVYPQDGVNTSTGQYTVEHPDADEYYKNNSDILSTEKASSSNTILTENEVYKLLAERGFSNCPITTTYSATGEYIEAVEISNNSSEKHPIYELAYTTANGEIWSITVVNNIITAFPMNYNFKHNKSTQVILSEFEYMISYDSVKDKFYKTIPHDDVLRLKMVVRIDADTLEKLAFGDIDKL